MSYPHSNFPILHPHQFFGARLYANRESLVEDFSQCMPRLQGSRIAEIGVALGDFSSRLIDGFAPAEFVAFDNFQMHNFPTHWGMKSEEIFGERTHREFFEDRFKDRSTKVICEEGSSEVTVPLYPDEYFDLIYVDARHTYEDVAVDADNARNKLAKHGVMIFNDYIMFDHLLGTPYGVVQVVNELVNTHGWNVLGFALQQHMFCDIAISPLPFAQLVG